MTQEVSGMNQQNSNAQDIIFCIYFTHFLDFIVLRTNCVLYPNLSSTMFESALCSLETFRLLLHGLNLLDIFMALH